VIIKVLVATLNIAQHQHMLQVLLVGEQAQFLIAITLVVSQVADKILLLQEPCMENFPTMAGNG
jgi:hypothetical protein